MRCREEIEKDTCDNGEGWDDKQVTTEMEVMLDIRELLITLVKLSKPEKKLPDLLQKEYKPEDFEGVL